MKVRCPACHHVHHDPPRSFACAGCGRHLAWGAPLLRAEQMSLFVPSGTAENLTLPLTVDEAAATRRTRRTHAEPGPAHPSPEPAHHGEPWLFQAAVSLVTAMLNAQQEDLDQVAAIVVDEARDEQPQLIFALTALLARLVHELDAAADGLGSHWLQMVALGVAGGPDEDDEGDVPRA